MASYQPKSNRLRALAGLWQIESAPMDHVDEAYYLGGDFEGRRQRIFYYMVWQDKGLGRWFAGFSRYGHADVPFSRTRCETLGGYGTLRDALAACEEHAESALTRVDTLTSPLNENDVVPAAARFSAPEYL